MTTSYAIAAGYEPPPIGHDLVAVEPVDTDGRTLHRAVCACGWSRRYVSEYRARLMHGRHAAEAKP